MDSQPLAQFIEQRVVKLIVEDNGRIISQGTGCIVSSKGHILTAAHVIFDTETNAPYSGKIHAIFDGEEQDREYSVIHKEQFTINIPLDGGEQQHRLPIDLALLQPLQEFSSFFRYFNLPFSVYEASILQKGVPIMIGGFPDDPKVLLEDKIGSILEYEGVKTQTPGNIPPEKTLSTLRLCVVKEGIISYTWSSEFPLSKKTYAGAFYVISNKFEKGGSGGALVDYEGNLHAIVVKRSYTKGEAAIRDGSGKTVSFRYFPSTTGIAISTRFLEMILSIEQITDDHE